MLFCIHSFVQFIIKFKSINIICKEKCLSKDRQQQVGLILFSNKSESFEKKVRIRYITKN